MVGVNEVKIVADRNADQARSALGGAAADDRRLEMIVGDGGGPSRARQIGFDRSLSDVVLFLDDDVIAGPLLALAHARHHTRRAGQVVVGYMPVAGTGPQGSAVARIYSSDYEMSCAAYDREPLTVLLMLWGGNVSIRRADGLVVPQASESFLHPQHEDRDFGLRCAAAGLVGVFDRNLVAEHRYERTPAQLLRASRDQAIAHGALRAAHPGTPPADYAAGLPRPVASVVRRARPRGPAAGLLRLARVSARACPAWLGPRLQQHVIALARAVEQCAGQHEASRSVPGPLDRPVAAVIHPSARS